MNKITNLNNDRNEAMDEIIQIEEVLIPSLYRKMMEFKGKLQLAARKKNLLWNKIKNIHKKIKND